MDKGELAKLREDMKEKAVPAMLKKVEERRLRAAKARDKRLKG